MESFPVTIRFPMHWGDMDALGHANNVRFFRWFESARIAYFERIALQRQPSSKAVGPILAHASCDYLRPLHYPADLVVGARVSKIGNTSVAMEYQVCTSNALATPYAKGTGVVVLVDYTSGKKITVSDALRSAIDALERGGRAQP